MFIDRVLKYRIQYADIDTAVVIDLQTESRVKGHHF